MNKKINITNILFFLSIFSIASIDSNLYSMRKYNKYRKNKYERTMQKLPPKTRKQFGYITRPASNPPRKIQRKNMRKSRSCENLEYLKRTKNRSPKETIEKLKNIKRKVYEELFLLDIWQEIHLMLDSAQEEVDQKRNLINSLHHQQHKYIYNK